MVGYRLHRLAIAGVALLLVSLQSAALRAEEPSFLTVGAGVFAIFDAESRAAQVEVQYRPDLRLWIFQPMIGANVSTDETAYVYAGVSLDIILNDHFVLRPSFAPGLYHEGDGRDLGGVLQFRTGLELAYLFDDQSRLGVEISHRSNAHIYNSNPGEESLMVFYHVPIGRR